MSEVTARMKPTRQYSRPDACPRKEPRPVLDVVGSQTILGAPSTSQEAATLPPHPLEDPQLSLFAWQEDAFEAWRRNNYRGIVEAVTGAGKTRLGLAAVSDATRQGRQVLLVVPTIELLHQWFGEIRKLLPWVVVGRLGDQYRDDFRTHEVIVSTMQSALANAESGVVNKLAGHGSRLLIVDEVHRAAAEKFSKILDEGYSRRLGLSATYQRTDGAHLIHLEPYFGGVAYRLWYDRARADRLIAPFDVALVGVNLSSDEAARYEALSGDIRKAHRTLHAYLPYTDVRPADFLAIVASWAAEETANARNLTARKYMRAVSSRQKLLAQTQAKITGLTELVPALAQANSSLIFSLTQTGADEAAAVVSERGIAATAVYSEMGRSDRKTRMAQFRSGDLPVLAAPRVLDEGVDVPEAELGIVLAANRSKRQLVQRLGRVIRRKADGRAGKFVVFYTRGTIEDPEVSGDEHLNEVLPHARELGWFGLPDDRDDILRFLENPPPAEPIEAPAAGKYRKATTPTPVQDSSGVPGRVLGGADKDRDRGGSSATAGGRADQPEEPQEAAVQETPPAWDGEVPEQLRGVAQLGRDSTQMYLRQIGKQTLLSAREEVDLGEAIEVGVLAKERVESVRYSTRREKRDLEHLVRQGASAHRRFTNANLRLVVNIAKKSAGRAGKLELLDLIQEGNLGLERAVQRWDFTLGYKFSTYASWWINQAISRAVADTSRTIRVPVHKADELRRAQMVLTDHENCAEISDPRDRAAADLEMSRQQLEDLLALDQRPLDIDRDEWLIEPGHTQLTTLGGIVIDEFAEDIDSSSIRAETRCRVDEALQTLDERSERVLRMRHGLTSADEWKPIFEPMRLDAIGLEMGVTRERIRQIEKQGKTDLLEALKELGVHSAQH